MPISPASLYSCPGKKASGRRGLTDPNDKYGGGLVIAGRADQRGMNMAAPRLVRTTVGAHKKEGGGTTRGTFFALRIEHLPGRQDLIQLRGCWVLTTETFMSVYDVASMRKTDPLSKKSIDELREDTSIIDLNWQDTIGYHRVEQSMRAYREHVASQDPDVLYITHMVRRHYYGKKSSWPRLENIVSVLGPHWTVKDLLACRFNPDPTFCPPSPPPGIGGTASGLEPLQPSFEYVPRDIFYLDNYTVRVGGGPSTPLHCVEYTDPDDPEGKPFLLHLRSRPATPDAPLTGTLILELREHVTPSALKQLQARQACPPPPPLISSPRRHVSYPPPLLCASQDLGGYTPTDLVYTKREIQIEQAQVTRPVDVLPEEMGALASLDRRDFVRTLKLFEQDDLLFEIGEPVTDRMAIALARTYFSDLIPGAREDLQQDVRNEIRSQMVPGYGANLHQAVARIPAMPFGRAMQLSGSHHMEWIGDAAKTFERVLHTRRDLEDLWGENCKPGWRIPETYHDEKGVVRKRADRCRP